MQQCMLCCAYIVRHIVCYGCLFCQQFIYMFPRHNLCIRCALQWEGEWEKRCGHLCSSAASPVWCIGVLGLSVRSHPRSLHLTLYRVGIDIIYTDSRVGTRLTPQAVVRVIGRGSALSRCASESITLWKDTFIDTTYTFVHCCKQ